MRVVTFLPLLVQIDGIWLVPLGNHADIAQGSSPGRSVVNVESIALNILFAASEAVPFAKTGGMADVGEALPRELAKLGHHPVVFIPAYRCAKQCGQPIESTDIRLSITVGSKQIEARLLRSRLRGCDVPVYLVENDAYFDRPQLYREDGRDYVDNCERFVFFCRAVMQSIRALGQPVDILHCNEWQTGLLPAYLKIEYAADPEYQRIGSLMTLHNLAYQGRFWHWDMLLTGLDWKHFNWHELEFHGQLNLLKAGIVFGDAVSTVSPRYAREIQNEPWGCGLEGILRHRHDSLFGILNGVDYDIWDPAHDPLIERTYDSSSWHEGKAVCKAALQREMGLPENPKVPLIGLIGRLADQKGWDLVAQVMRRWVQNQDVQWVILGTGEEEYHGLLADLSRHHPQQLAVHLGFSDRLAHRIESAADMFLMASRYEPCGLKQLYSLKYGAVPVVHETGGLADTITDATPRHLDEGKANGFVLPAYDTTQLETTLHRACNMYRDQPDAWNRIVTTGMDQDWSWTRSTERYVDLYQRILAGKQ